MQENSSGVDSKVLRQIVDEHQIRQVLLNYCQGVDRKNWKQVLACYHDDAVDSHGAFKGSPDRLVKWMQGTHKNVEFSMHTLTNTTVTFFDDGRRARSESYVVCYKSMSSAEGDAFLPAGEEGPVRRTVASRFIDVLENRGSGWRIARRDVLLEFARREANELHLAFGPGATVSRRDENDLLYRPVD
ncbi:hypothetical protein BMF89_16630 [Arthrobacter sp. SRS-W-1-2016]|uniref:nuclear transport factor 2 family protein n=1 Tax=Arthrobacter sp. SRS-W-1-2016 TaxID=1930254 RepID=UPI000990E5B9|nr:nuclear transport factor 2 family protein [Arthrobacter sp. SRS-W-1-2016]OOP60493.1 hypothetical protein BMF89_16630 [Arthrobacter sp. SRS-W-1-2016]